MNNQNNLIILCLCVSLTSTLLFTRVVCADEVPDLSKYLREKLTEVDQASSETPSVDLTSDGVVLQDVNLDISPSVTFGLPGALSLSISPEVDFVLVPDPAPSP